MPLFKNDVNDRILASKPDFDAPLRAPMNPNREGILFQPPPAIEPLRDAGPSKTMILVPYGSTYLRLTTFPLIPHRSPP
jgi:hypothetical protein